MIAGPNGSGKTTLVKSGALGPYVGALPSLYLNPDEIALTLARQAPVAPELERLREAQSQSDQAVDDAIASSVSIAVETVLSSDKFKDRVLRAKSAGYKFGFVFVTLGFAAMNVSRVGDRVADGGHDVPVDRILARRLRSHAAFGWFARAAHAGLLIDNSELARLIAQKHPGSSDWTVYDQSLHPDLTGQL